MSVKPGALFARRRPLQGPGRVPKDANPSPHPSTSLCPQLRVRMEPQELAKGIHTLSPIPTKSWEEKTGFRGEHPREAELYREAEGSEDSLPGIASSNQFLRASYVPGSVLRRGLAT